MNGSIVFEGLPGAGKTSLAESFCRRFDGYFLPEVVVPPGLTDTSRFHQNDCVKSVTLQRLSTVLVVVDRYYMSTRILEGVLGQAPDTASRAGLTRPSLWVVFEAPYAILRKRWICRNRFPEPQWLADENWLRIEAQYDAIVEEGEFDRRPVISVSSDSDTDFVLASVFSMAKEIL